MPCRWNDQVIEWGAVTLAMALFAGASDTPPMRFAQLIVRERMTIRVRPRAPALLPQQSWRERRGPRCIPANSIGGAALIGPKSVDMVLRNNTRVRVRLENSCPAIDYYSGFYIKPNPDGMICADRDAIRSRMGGQCEIEAIRRLIPSRGD